MRHSIARKSRFLKPHFARLFDLFMFHPVFNFDWRRVSWRLFAYQDLGREAGGELLLICIRGRSSRFERLEFWRLWPSTLLIGRCISPRLLMAMPTRFVK